MPVGIYRVQSPGFLKIVYSSISSNPFFLKLLKKKKKKKKKTVKWDQGIHRVINSDLKWEKGSSIYFPLLLLQLWKHLLAQGNLLLRKLESW